MEQIEVQTKAERQRQIMAVLAQHGLAAVGGNGTQFKAEQAREACEELGTTFIKLGQVLSTRGDMLPEEFLVELAKLQDSVPPVDTSVIEVEIAESLGSSPHELFASFEHVPLGSASIGQVHLATLNDGREVVVKIRKPGIKELVEIDLDILTSLAASSSRRFPALAEYDVRGMVAEFADMLRAELDYTREGRNIELFRSYFASDKGYALPEVIPEFCTSNVLVLTVVPGEKASSDIVLTDKRRDLVAQRIARFVLEPAFMHGVFHADPHPGNISVQENGTVGVVDFGMIGKLTDKTRRYLADLFVALDRHDVQRFTDRLIDVAPPTRPIDRVSLSQELGRLIERYMSTSLERVALGPAINDLLDLIRCHALHLSGSVAMFFKAIAMSEGLIEKIDPEKTIQDFIKPVSEKIALSRLTSDEWLERMKLSAVDAAELSIDLPRRADRVLADLERGNLRVWARVEDLQPMVDRMERMVERVNITLIAAACIVSLAVLLMYYHPQGLYGVVGGIVWAAIVITVLAVLRILWQTLRKGG
ncbi:MAG: AarF/ABC1/UbiB kinase family protein [Candidatus Eremiobacteraeota bacterium]|nr:AarF/ABC1/UbiB kinase family protein [Candidatus Eremiobacteraeota bacterium]